MTADTILVRDGEPASVHFDNDVVLLSIASGAYFSLNAAGSQIWSMLVRPCQVEEIFAAFAEEYDIDRDTMTKDVTNFLDALLERRLVRVVHPDATA